MLGKASEIKTKLVYEVVDMDGNLHRIDDMIDVALNELPAHTEIISIQYQVIGSNGSDGHYALIIYKEAGR